jgi:hypothetical protein
MRTFLLRGRIVIVASLALIPWLSALPTRAADQSMGAGTPSQELPQAISGAQSSIPSGAPVVGIAPGQATWVDDIATALGSYFKENYPTQDFAPYVTKLTLVQNALDRGDRRTVQVEMGAFLKLLANRSHGISEGAADELVNFTRMVMPVREYGIFFPRSWPEEYEATVHGPGLSSKEMYSRPSGHPLIPSPP